MRLKMIAVLLLCASFAGAKEAAPTTQPTTQPMAVSTTQPAEGANAEATTQPALTKKFPTPAELIQKMRSLEKEQSTDLKVAYFDLTEPLVEKPADFSLFGGNDSMTLHMLLSRLDQARDDKDIRAVLVTLGSSGLNLAQAQEVRDSLGEIRKAGKKVFVYADSYDTVDYTLASGATNICLLEGGQIMIPGVGIEATFAKGLLDKVGVQADYVQIGEYKGADEQMTRIGPSDELRGELNKLMDSMYEQIVDGISLNRNLTRDVVKQLIDDTIMTGQAAKDRGLVDHLVDIDGLRDLISEEMGDKIQLVHDYAMPTVEPVDLSNPFGLLAMLSRKPEATTKPTIALIYAAGVIVDGEGGGGLFENAGVASEPMRRAFRIAARDENVKAVLIRIDSPGGSALASEVMWQAARRCAEKKPVIISIGNMAASGGYYLASSGQYIFADPSAIVGSIGVVGGKFVTKGLYEKLGITTEAFYRGRNSDLFSSSQPFNDRQRRMVTNWMRQTYEQFTQRVMTTREGKIKDIDLVARGRIFVAKQAKDLGMVDEIGGMRKAISYAADQAKLTPGEYDIRILPQPKTLADLFGAGGGTEASMPFQPKITIDAGSMLNLVSPATRKMLLQEVQTLELLQDRPVILMTPYQVDVR